MNNNHDNRIVLNPRSITSNIVSQYTSTNQNDGHCNTETLVNLEEDLTPMTPTPTSSEQNAAVTHGRQLHVIIPPSCNEQNTVFVNGTAQTVLVSREYEAYRNFRYSPPPAYTDLYQIPSHHSIQPAPHPQQILIFPQHQNVQHPHQQRLQYPQQESLQYHEEISYPYRREGNFPALYEPLPTTERGSSTNKCFGVDAMWCSFCVFPICLLIFVLYYGFASL